MATQTYLIVDGENIDATIGNSLLGRRPDPEERPRWDRVRDFAVEAWGQPVKPLFFLNASNGAMPMSFVQALLAMDYRPVPLAGSSSEKVVDLGIKRTLEAIAERDGDVLLASHDGDFAPEVERAARRRPPGRHPGAAGVRQHRAVRARGDGDARPRARRRRPSTSPLPRVRIIPIEEFDPAQFL